MRRALVVDDARAMCAALSALLKRNDFECMHAEDAEQAAKLIKSEPKFDLITLDWNMPGKSGLELLREIRNWPECDGVVILMVTTESEAKRVQAARDAGANDYVMKPFSPKAFHDIVNLHF